MITEGSVLAAGLLGGGVLVSTGYFLVQGTGLGDIATVGQFGFAAFMAYLIFRAYQNVQDKVLKAFERSSTVMESTTNAIEQNTRVIGALVEKADGVEDRLRILENCTHGTEGHLSCPALVKHMRESV